MNCRYVLLFTLKDDVDDWSKEKQDRSDKFLALWIGGSTLPVSAVQDPNMLRYVKSLNPDATVPDRRKLTDGIATLCDKNIATIREALSNARRVNITTDIWSSKLSADSYIGVTAHFINQKERKRQWLKISKLLERLLKMGSNLCLLKVAPNSMRTTKEPILLPNCSLFCSPTTSRTKFGSC